MSANRFTRAARPLGRSVAAVNTNPLAAGRQRFTTSSLRRAATNNGAGTHAASKWSLSGVFAVAAGASLLGWGVSELRHQGSGAASLDGTSLASRYASMREMEQVCYPRFFKKNTI